MKTAEKDWELLDLELIETLLEWDCIDYVNLYRDKNSNDYYQAVLVMTDDNLFDCTADSDLYLLNKLKDLEYTRKFYLNRTIDKENLTQKSCPDNKYFLIKCPYSQDKDIELVNCYEWKTLPEDYKY